MQFQPSRFAQRILPSGLYDRLAPNLARLDSAVSGKSDSDISRRVALFAFAIRVLSAAIAYLSQVLLARWMGDFEYGIFVAVWVAIIILGALACLGFQTGIIRFISEYRSSGEDHYLRGAITGSLTWALAFSTLLAGFGAVTVWLLGSLITNYYVLPIVLALACLPMIALQEVLDGIARAHNWPGLALGPTFIIRPLAIIAAMGIAVLLGFEADATTAMTSAIVATWLVTLVQFGFLRGRLKSEVPPGPRAYRPMHWLAITAPIFLIEGFYNLLTNVDILMVSHYLTPEDVAVYFAAAKTMALAHFVYFAVKAAAAHRFSAYLSAGDQERYVAFIQETVRWTFWPTLVMAAVMAVLGRYFLLMFGSSFEAGESVIWILALGVVARASVGPAESVLTMSGEQNACAVVYASSLVINLLLNMTLIPVYGLNGAAIATAAAMLFEAGILYATAKRRLGLHVFIIESRSHGPVESGGPAE